MEVLVSGTAMRDPRIAEVLCAARHPEIARDSVASAAERCARQAAERTAFATATRVPAPADTVSDRFAGREEAVDSAESSAAGNEDATTAVAVVALCSTAPWEEVVAN